MPVRDIKDVDSATPAIAKHSFITEAGSSTPKTQPLFEVFLTFGDLVFGPLLPAVRPGACCMILLTKTEAQHNWVQLYNRPSPYKKVAGFLYTFHNFHHQLAFNRECPAISLGITNRNCSMPTPAVHPPTAREPLRPALINLIRRIGAPCRDTQPGSGLLLRDFVYSTAPIDKIVIHTGQTAQTHAQEPLYMAMLAYC